MIRALANASKEGMKINGIGRNLFASAFVALACLAAVAEDEAPAAPTGLGLAVVDSQSFTISGTVDRVWTFINTVALTNSTGNQGFFYDLDLEVNFYPSGSSISQRRLPTKLCFDLSNYAGIFSFDYVVVTGPPHKAGEYIPGWSNAVFEATSATIAGLSRDTTYAVRVRAEWVKTRITMTSSVATAWT